MHAYSGASFVPIAVPLLKVVLSVKTRVIMLKNERRKTRNVPNKNLLRDITLGRKLPDALTPSVWHVRRIFVYNTITSIVTRIRSLRSY